MPAVAHAPQPERLMRYLFDSPLQARRHVHEMDRRRLLFFPDPFLDVSDGQPVKVELGLAGSAETLTVRGEVHSVESGSLRGAWLDLFALRLFDRTHLAGEPPRRMHRRMATEAMVRVHRPGQPATVARLADVSCGGARVVGAGGWAAGEAIILRELASAAELRGDVIWCRDGEIAVRFLRSDATSRRGAVRLVEAAARSWEAARETRHPAACRCEYGGALLEPLLPRAALRSASAG